MRTPLHRLSFPAPVLCKLQHTFLFTTFHAVTSNVADASIAVVVPSIANLLPEIVNAGEYTGSDFTVLFDKIGRAHV